ncbi:hypothetical protein H5410_063284 [Solanum commersonii]|uniref:Ubiquitin-like domain-containing protein n=1 Tax=Solanum commersonii TaxID=4109 RepID=A0A9J5WF65_SOLCO|nr:hypothetical protein H5410_063284 [Solanum commersonii]
MNLVIQILTGTLFHIRVAKDTSVADLKKEISNQEKLPENRLILMLDTGHGDSIMLNDDEISLIHNVNIRKQDAVAKMQELSQNSEL